MIAIDSAYIGLLIKMVGITYAAEFAVNVQRLRLWCDCGRLKILQNVDPFVVSLPVLMAFIDTVGSLL